MVYAGPRIRVRVRSVAWEAESICSYELCPLDGQALPPFTAGGHIDLHLAGGLVRSYSLINSQDERTRYVIAVNKSATGQGGSRHIHERIRPGDIIEISSPRNNFALDESASRSTLIAGGIGITPILCMIRRLEELGRSWELFYCARTRSSAAFLDALASFEAAKPGRVHLNFDQEPNGRMLELTPIVAAAASGTHFYCCGPASMLKAFQAATVHLDAGRVHLEYFTAPEPAAASGGFSIVLARSGQTLVVPPARSILDVVEDAGIDVQYSCRQGICRSCETSVLEGTPEHRDHVLSPQERAANRTMMICCSGCQGDRLVLDL